MPLHFALFQPEMWNDDELYSLMRSIDIEGKSFLEVEEKLKKGYAQVAAAWAYFRTPGQPYWSLARQKKLIEVSNQYRHRGQTQWLRVQSDGLIRREFPGTTVKILRSRAYDLRERGRTMDPLSNSVLVTIDQAFNPDYVPAVDPLSRLGTAAGLSAYREPASSSSTNLRPVADDTSRSRMALSNIIDEQPPVNANITAVTSSMSSLAVSAPSASTLTLAQSGQSQVGTGNLEAYGDDYNDEFGYADENDDENDDEGDDLGGRGKKPLTYSTSIVDQPSSVQTQDRSMPPYTGASQKRKVGDDGGVSPYMPAFQKRRPDDDEGGQGSSKR